MTPSLTIDLPNNYLYRAVTLRCRAATETEPRTNIERRLHSNSTNARTARTHYFCNLPASNADENGEKWRRQAEGFRKGMSAGNEGNKVRHKARTSTPDKLYGGDAAREERAEIAAARD